MKEKIESGKARVKQHRNKLIVSASLVAALSGLGIGYAHSTKATRMHHIGDDKKSSEVFANVNKLEDAENVIFTSGSGSGKAEVFATISHDADDMVIQHDGIRVEIDSQDKKVLGSRDNEIYLDDETISNVIDMCVNGTPDYKVELQ